MQGPHLLVVEDEPQLRANLARGLAEEEFSVATAANAEAAQALIAERGFDAIVLDLRLPGQDGLDFMRGLRAAGNPTPVIVLTARGELDDRVTGLDAGADDYLAKPFAFAELVARVRAVMRRRSGMAQPLLTVADLEFDSVKRRARRAGRDLALSPKETILLELLMRNAGQTVTRDMIIEVVWGAGYSGLTNLIEVFVNRLRQKIAAGARDSLIVTVRGVGYSMRASESSR